MDAFGTLKTLFIKKEKALKHFCTQNSIHHEDQQLANSKREDASVLNQLEWNLTIDKQM